MQLLRNEAAGRVELITMKIKRREFLGFFLLGGLVSFLAKLLLFKSERSDREAMFWRRKD